MVSSVGAALVMAVVTMDPDAVWADFQQQIAAEKEERLKPPLVRLWDGSWNLRGVVSRINSANIQEINNDVGVADFELPLDYWLSEWVVNLDERTTKNIHVTVDKDGARWGGRMESFSVVKNEDGTGILRLRFKHDIEELNHILVYSNPWLPPEVQFPRLWLLFGPSAWALKTTLLVNIIRLYSSAWAIKPDPMNPNGWDSLDQSTWMLAVKPGSIDTDNSLPAIVFSRFKTMFDTAQDIMEDAQLSWECRRYLDGDTPPWEGANLRHGCLVFDIVDKSGFTSGTSFGGNIFTGLLKAFVNIDEDGLTEGVDIIDDPNSPPEYREPDFKGTLPEAPWVIYRDGVNTGIQSSDFTYKPPTSVGVVAGGHSMPGVNELISATIQMIGDLTAMIPGVPPLGGIADALLKPLYTDVFLAFGKHRSQQRAYSLGSSHYHEHWAEGGDRAYTLAWLLAMRTGMWVTREQTSHTVVVADGAPYRIGQRGYGHYWLGDRIGSTVRGMPEGRVFVDRVSELSLKWDRDNVPTWNITIGSRAIEDPVIKAYERIRKILSILRDMGVL